MIFMTFWWRWFQTLSCGFVSLGDTCMLCFLESYWIRHSSLQFSESWSASEFLYARHCRLHWKFQLSPRVFDCFLLLTIFQIDDMNASQPSSIIELWFFQSPFCFFFSERLFPFWIILFFPILSGFTNLRPYLRPYMIWSRCQLNCGQSPPGPQTSLWRFSLNKMNSVNPPEESHKHRFASTFQ